MLVPILVVLSQRQQAPLVAPILLPSFPIVAIPPPITPYVATPSTSIAPYTITHPPTIVATPPTITLYASSPIVATSSNNC